MRAVLISTYEMGRQPFGLASPAAWISGAGSSVTCLDLAVQKLEPETICSADLIAFYLPMHTATRLAARVIPEVKRLNPSAHLCAYGLYAPLNAAYLRGLGIETIVGGEYEESLRDLATDRKVAGRDIVSLGKQRFLIPERSGLPPLDRYAKLRLPDGSERLAGYTEASRGCKHFCRHCPIVPVYRGSFRIVQRDVVMEDIARQVAMGARHITFGDPDFFNGIGHAIEIVRSLHREHPGVTYDVTVKVEHLLQHSKWLPVLRDTGCAFVTSAIESVDDHVLEILEKGHTRADFLRLVRLFETTGLNLAPTFVAFHPWITLEGYRDLLALLASLHQVDSVSSVQLVVRLLIPNGSRLLERPEIQSVIGEFDGAALSYAWTHPDPGVDALQRDVEALVRKLQTLGADRGRIFRAIWGALERAMGSSQAAPEGAPRTGRCTIPYLTEPWFC
ncbi:MAG: CUAEP/CCAEP-tail radical SAM (seleno)protein [Bryobacteraceae bacterium]